MESKINLRDVYLILLGLSILGFFASTEYWIKIGSVILFVIAAILLIR